MKPLTPRLCRLSLIALTAAAALAAGCNRLTVENYDKIRVGMRYEEVKQVLGAPDKCSDVLAVKTCKWGNDERHIQVNFVADQVVLFTSENLR
ncbi:MAG TPA: hypothetical protein VJ673_15850 [Aromatoleum sp.]|uniref:hypothetical protein n=1 Tax=Aromatoleum sp. TaxID=2307007 RepID=UPI002B48BD42|nr:hypothetical protein [Aromatoleum sp.]HJV27160.1 hypothetical protein [Aromatoleum sp.]